MTFSMLFVKGLRKSQQWMMQLDIASNLSTKAEENGMGMGIGMVMGLSFRLT